MKKLEQYQKKLFDGGMLKKEELMELAGEPLDELCQAADEIRRHFCGNAFDLCAVISAKGGACPEDCRFCAQSCANRSSKEIPHFSLLPQEELLKDAVEKEKKNIMAYGMVSSGRVLSMADTEQLCVTVRELKKKTNLRICGSLGLLDRERLEKLRDAGMQMVHNNLESSEKFFSSLCTTHSYEEKKEVIRAAHDAGLRVCSGALFGVGETMEDRIELALEERALGVKSIPVNMLDPVEGTPFEGALPLKQDDMCRIVAILRFALPDAFIRLAAGREYLPDKGKSCFRSGANAAISGDFLTTMGISIRTDLEMLEELGYEIAGASLKKSRNIVS